MGYLFLCNGPHKLGSLNTSELLFHRTVFWGKVPLFHLLLAGIVEASAFFWGLSWALGVSDGFSHMSSVSAGSVESWEQVASLSVLGG